MLKPCCSGGWCPTKVRKLLVPILKTPPKVSPCVFFRVEWSVFSRETLKQHSSQNGKNRWRRSLATVDRLSIDETSELGWKSWKTYSDYLDICIYLDLLLWWWLEKTKSQNYQMVLVREKMVMNRIYHGIESIVKITKNKNLHPWQHFCDHRDLFGDGEWKRDPFWRLGKTWPPRWVQEKGRMAWITWSLQDS